MAPFEFYKFPLLPSFPSLYHSFALAFIVLIRIRHLMICYNLNVLVI